MRALLIRRRCTLSALARARPASTHVRYRLRMRIEAFFKDGKQHFALELCRLQTGARICAFCAPLPPNWEAQVCTRAKLSWLTLPLEWLDSLALQWLFNAFPDLPTITADLSQTG